MSQGYTKMRYSGRAYNIVTSKTTTLQYPNLCWMNIGIEKLASPLLDGGKYYFYCNIGGVEYFYSCEIEKLRAFCKKCNDMRTGTPRYTFFIDYVAGELRVNPGDANESLRLVKSVWL